MVIVRLKRIWVVLGNFGDFSIFCRLGPLWYVVSLFSCWFSGFSPLSPQEKSQHHFLVEISDKGLIAHCSASYRLWVQSTSGIFSLFMNQTYWAWYCIVWMG